MDQNILEILQFLCAISIPAVLLAIGFFVGRSVERNHLRELAREEQAMAHILLTPQRKLPENWDGSDAVLVSGEAAIAVDYFKVFVGGWRKLFGGEMRSYETLVDRARRQATVRMLHQAQHLGANVIWNIRYETATIVNKEQNTSPGGVEVIAYGTAMRVWEKGSRPAANVVAG